MKEKLTVGQRRTALLSKLKILLESQMQDEVKVEKQFVNDKGLSSDVLISKELGVIHITTTESDDLNSVLSFDDGRGGRDVFSGKDYVCFCWDDKKENKTLFFFSTPEKVVGPKGLKKAEVRAKALFSGLEKDGKFRLFKGKRTYENFNLLTIIYQLHVTERCYHIRRCWHFQTWRQLLTTRFILQYSR